MHFVTKVNRTLVFSAEMQCKLCRRQAGGSGTPRIFVGVRDVYITRKISTRLEGRKRGLPKIPTSAPVCAAQLSSTLQYSTHLYILSSKRKRKEADHILYISFVIFLYNTTSSSTRSNRNSWDTIKSKKQLGCKHLKYFPAPLNS